MGTSLTSELCFYPFTLCTGVLLHARNAKVNNIEDGIECQHRSQGTKKDTQPEKVMLRRDATCVIHLTLIPIPECPSGGKGSWVVETASLNVLNMNGAYVKCWVISLPSSGLLSYQLCSLIPQEVWVIEEDSHSDSIRF